MRSTLEGDKIGYVFQPIVSLDGRQTRQFELLARISGCTSPFSFVTLAEEIGLIAEFDYRNCRQALSFLSEYQALAQVPLAVNVSCLSLQSEAFAVPLLALLDRHPEARGRLKFEITESARIEDFARVERVVQDLRQRGYQVGLDDFGAGSNSFTTFYNLTVDFLKIDGAYVTRMRHSSRDRAMLRAMVGLAGDFGIPTVAEMIEREDQAREVQRLGVDLGQGYLFGRPGQIPLPAVLQEA